MKLLVAGAAGFIGSHVYLYLLKRGDDVVGIDNLNDYYDVNIKIARLKRVESLAAGELSEEVYPEIGSTGVPIGKFRFDMFPVSTYGAKVSY